MNDHPKGLSKNPVIHDRVFPFISLPEIFLPKRIEKAQESDTTKAQYKQ